MACFYRIGLLSFRKLRNKRLRRQNVQNDDTLAQTQLSRILFPAARQISFGHLLEGSWPESVLILNEPHIESAAGRQVRFSAMLSQTVLLLHVQINQSKSASTTDT